MQVGDRLLAVLAANVGRNVRHRARSVEGDHRCKVIDAGRSQLLDVPAHARRLELENSGRLTRGEQGEGLCVIKRNFVQVNLNAASLPDPVNCGSENRQVCKAKEIKLKKAEGLDAVHLDLRHHPFGVRRTLKGHDLGKRFTTNHHSSRMRRGVPHDPFELLGEAN